MRAQANFLNSLEVASPSPKKPAATKYKFSTVMKVTLGAVLLGYKVRRILSRHVTVQVLKKEYYDLLAFTFGLQHEMRATKNAVSSKTKQLMVQSVRDLNQKRRMLNRVLETVLTDHTAQWLRDSRN